MKKVVIIGGGFTGSTVAKRLENEFDVTLIDCKEYFEFTPGILRVIVEPNHLKKIQVLHRHYLKRTKVVVGDVEEIRGKNVVLEGKKIPFDYLVISSGSSYSLPFKDKVENSTRGNELYDSHRKLVKSDEVTIIGGGLVGTELAGEIMDKYPEKKVKIVELSKHLISRNNPKGTNYAEKLLKKKGVEFFFEEKIINVEENDIYTTNDKKIKSDMVFLCTGIKPNNEFIFNSFPELRGKKELSNDYLQLKGKKNIFIGGDVAGIKEEKLAQNAERHAITIIKNVKYLEKGKELEKYRHKKSPMVISIGKWKGIFQYKNFVLTGIIPGIMKQFIEWKEMSKYK